MKKEKTWPQTVADWCVQELLPACKRLKMDIKDCKLSPENLSKLIMLVRYGLITRKRAREILPVLIQTGRSPIEFVECEEAKNVV